MDVYVIDTETFYDKDYSLSKLTTEEYINDPRFELIGLSIKKNECTAEWYSGADTAGFLKGFDFSGSMIVCHNTMFDAAILDWKYGVKPKVWADTMSMARFVRGVHESASLAALAKAYGLGEKGTEVINALGKKRQDFSTAELARYGEYCVNDVNLTFALFKRLLPSVPKSELKLIDLTLRFFVEPVICVDPAVLKERLTAIRAEKDGALQSLQRELGVGTNEKVRELLSSNKKFTELLTARGITVPTKTSPATGKQIPALGKKDSGFIDLQNVDNPFVQLLCSVRLGTKSTMEEGRVENFLAIAERNKGKLPIPLFYCGAHTSRWGGGDQINLQNLPSRDPKKKALKNSMVAPPGYVIINCDSSQIEARIVAWFAGQQDMLDAFRNKKDVYRLMGSRIYNKLPEDITPEERFLAKTVVLGCLAEGTLVLCEGGWKPIEQVTIKDRVWDGQNWVEHQGLLKKGFKETLNLCGLWLTPDHKVLCGTEWKDAQSVRQDASTLYRTLITGAESWSSLDMWRGSTGGYGRSSLNATAVDPNTHSIIKTSKILKAPGAIHALLQSLTKHIGKAIGYTQMLCQTTYTANGYLIDYPQQSPDATTLKTGHIHPTGAGVYMSAKSGEMIDGRFYGMFNYSMGGTYQIMKWTGPITTKGTNPETSGLFPVGITLETVEKYLSCNQEYKNLRRNLMTYDLAFAGPQNRFTVLTDAGPIVVHNCGYGTGWKKLQSELKAAGVEMSDEDCQMIINIYRNTNADIKRLWQDINLCLKKMNNKVEYEFGKHKCLKFYSDGIELPSGYVIQYPEFGSFLEEDKPKYFYIGRKGKTFLWYGTILENTVQGLARCVVAEQMLEIAKRYKVALTVHDSVVVVCKEEEREAATQYVEQCMSKTPSWAEGLPVSCESGWGLSYGAA
jgi:DNA polymerase I-like protein with 3'-5' exonuclease and polymerase domains